MKLCLLFLLTLTLTEQLPLDFKGSAGGEKAEARVLKFPSEEIMPGVLAIPANIELPDCSDPKNNALCQTQSQCQDNDCLLATLLTEKNNDLTIEKNEDKSSFDMADFFDLVYDTMEKVDRTRRDTYDCMEAADRLRCLKSCPEKRQILDKTCPFTFVCCLGKPRSIFLPLRNAPFFSGHKPNPNKSSSIVFPDAYSKHINNTAIQEGKHPTESDSFIPREYLRTIH